MRGTCLDTAIAHEQVSSKTVALSSLAALDTPLPVADHVEIETHKMSVSDWNSWVTLIFSHKRYARVQIAANAPSSAIAP